MPGWCGSNAPSLPVRPISGSLDRNLLFDLHLEYPMFPRVFDHICQPGLCRVIFANPSNEQPEILPPRGVMVAKPEITYRTAKSRIMARTRVRTPAMSPCGKTAPSRFCCPFTIKRRSRMTLMRKTFTMRTSRTSRKTLSPSVPTFRSLCVFKEPSKAHPVAVVETYPGRQHPCQPAVASSPKLGASLPLKVEQRRRPHQPRRDRRDS